MPFENIVGLHVTDPAGYQRYRDAMTPILVRMGGGFRYDFVVDQVLKSEASHPINRVFAIQFPDRQTMTAFFAYRAYKQIRDEHFTPAVGGATIISEYER
jgi:uncharacterized protein (DUF1330 family)